MNVVELFLNNPATTKLDLDQKFDIALQYSIADIRDISKRNSAFSKTILLPGTKNNNYWMGNLYDINADFTIFNPNIKTPCALSVNSEIVMQGFLQLRKIKKLVNVDPQGNQIIYEVVIFNNAVDLMTELGEKSLNQLNLSELTHTYNFNNIVYSWTQSYTHGYVYPMYGLPNTPNSYFVTDFYPAYYSRYLLDKVFQEAGFGWTGSLKTNPQFSKEILPFVGSGSQSVSEALIDAENFRVGITQSFATQSLRPPGITNTSVFLANPNTPGGGNPAPQFRYSFIYPMNADNFQDPFNPQNDYYDNGNDWNTTTNIWTTSVNRKWKPIWQLNYDVSFRNPTTQNIIQSDLMSPGGPSVQQTKTSIQLEISHILEYQLPSNINWVPFHTVLIKKNGWTRQQVAWAPNLTVTDNINFYDDSCPEMFFVAGTKVRMRVVFNPSNGGSTAPFDIFCQTIGFFYINQFGNPVLTGPTSSFPKMELTVTYKTSPQNYLFSNGQVFAAQEGDPIVATDYISSKVKQKDFLNDLIKRYNLYIQVDPTNERLLILDTRTDFYNKVLNLDWTKKKDFSSEDEISLLSELQFKEMLFTMKADSDEINKDYTAKTGDVLGQYKYTFGNEFVKGQKKIESPFSPTPLIKTSFGAITPALDPQDPKVNTRVLYWGGFIQTPYTNFTWQLKGTGVQQYFTKYPYAGHFDNPYSPTLDIHFGTPDYMYYSDYGVLPSDTMYETYWADYVDSIEDGRLVKSKFYLDEYDIRLIKDNFWAKIFILDSYYYVNKIIDYKPLENGVTQVELLKIKEGFAYKKKSPIRASINRPIKLVKPSVQIGDFGINNSSTIGINGGLIIGNNNVGGGKVITGSVSMTNKQLILGDDNFLQGDNSGILGGSNNKVFGNSNWIIQSQNIDLEESNNLIVIGRNGGTFSDSNTMWMGNDIRGDLMAKPSQIYPEEYSSTNLSINSFNLGQSDWRYIEPQQEVKIQSGKLSRPKEMSVLGYFDIESGSGTFSLGNQVVYKEGLVEVSDNLDITGIMAVGGELFVGQPNLSGIGVFYSLQDQTATASTPTKVLLDTTNISDGVSIGTQSQIIIDFVAAYRMTVTVLLESSSNNIEDVYFWLKFNGTNYPYSSHITNVPGKKNATTPSDTIISFDFIGKSLNPYDTVEVWWQTSSADVKLKTRTLTGIPQSPSVIININKIA